MSSQKITVNGGCCGCIVSGMMLVILIAAFKWAIHYLL